jgi:hypothetical protein
MNNNKNNGHRTTNNTELHNRENSTLQVNVKNECLRGNSGIASSIVTDYVK